MPVDRSNAEDLQTLWRRRIVASRNEQQLHHGVWASDLAFARGQQWLVWQKNEKRLRHISAVDKRYQGRELFTADRIREHREAALGELTSDDDRPQLISAQEGQDPEQIAGALNGIATYAWDQEWNAPNVLSQTRRLTIDLGKAAIRCRWEPNAGPQTSQPQYAPLGPDGSPLPAQAQMGLAAQGAMPDGSLPKFQKLDREGRTVWEVYSAFQIFTPPGVVHENDFPWEVVGKPVLVDEIKDVYGVDVPEDTGILSSAGLMAGSAEQSGGMAGRLRDHAWLFHCYDRPSRRYPKGRCATLAGADYTLCDQQGELPYELGGEYKSGIVYFHWWRLSDTFHSQGLVTTMKDPQRMLNRGKTQNIEIFDRGQPKMLVKKGDYPGDTTGAPFEIIEMSRNAQAPQITPGIQPGPVMFQHLASLDEDLSHASTISPLRLGENPANVDTYSQLSLLNDVEQGKRGSIIAEHRQRIGDLVMLSLVDVKKYWPDEKQGLILGPEQAVQKITMLKSQIPMEYRVKPASGQPQPRSQGAQIKKIDAIWAVAQQSTVFQLDPAAWVDWYKRSLDAGQPQKLPKMEATSQEQIAALENMEMRAGEWVEPAYYDPIEVHVPIHRQEEDRARVDADPATAAMIEQHILKHLEWAQKMATFTGPQTPPGQPGQPPQPGQPSGQPGQQQQQQPESGAQPAPGP